MQIWLEIVNVVIVSLVSLVTMFVTTRLGGKRQISQMSIFDYANSITVGSIAAEMATNLESWYRPFTALLIYGAAAWVVHYCACKSLRARVILDGRALLLMHDGVIRKSELKRAAIDLNEFLAQARVAGYHDLNDLQSALLETNGQISFLPKCEARPATAQDVGAKTEPVSLWYDLILDGEVIQSNLRQSGFDESWLQKQLHAWGIPRIEETFYAACDQYGRFYASRAE